MRPRRRPPAGPGYLVPLIQFIAAVAFLGGLAWTLAGRG
jgi:hypothetical protein